MYKFIENDDARRFILELHSVDLHDYTLPEMREINAAQYFAALTCVELSKRYLQAIAHGDYQAARLAERTTQWAGDPGYLENKAVTLRAMAEESRVCREVLALAIMAFKPEGS